MFDVREDVYHGRFLTAAYRQEACPAGHTSYTCQHQWWRGEDIISIAAAAFCTGEKGCGFSKCLRNKRRIHYGTESPRYAYVRHGSMTDCRSSFSLARGYRYASWYATLMVSSSPLSRERDHLGLLPWSMKVMHWTKREELGDADDAETICLIFDREDLPDASIVFSFTFSKPI